MIPGITAAGSTQATATQLPLSGPITTADVQSVPTSGAGVILPGYYTSAPLVFVIRNSDATTGNSLNIYPPLVKNTSGTLVSGTINGSTSAYALSQGSTVKIWAFSATDWVVS